MPRLVNDLYLFWGGECSNWYKSNFSLDGMSFNCVEQFMMYKKAQTFGDQNIANQIMKTSDPAIQKKLGRKVSNFDAVIWSNVSRDIVFRGLMAKFTQIKSLNEFLMSFDPLVTFVEASPYDKIWGIGLGEGDPRAADPNQWQGTNWLGDLITEVRGCLETLK